MAFLVLHLGQESLFEMSSFTTPLDARESDDGNHWMLLTEFDYERGALGSKDIIRVPAGFITDLASVPQAFWNIIPPMGRYSKAAVLHDWLYACQIFSKEESDSIFCEAMSALSVPVVERDILYEGVKIGGMSSWVEHQKRGDPALIEAGGLPIYPDIVFS